jgi:PAS domain S-box-containing protein
MFTSAGLPHGICFLWNPGLLWLHVVSDSLIALAYFLIPVALVRIARWRNDIRFNAIFFCFCAFIVACGITHVMDVVTLWHPVYWASGTMKAVTAAISIVTCVLLLHLSGKDFSRFERLFEYSPDAIIVTDRKGNICDANARAEEMFGHQRGDLMERPLEALIPERFRQNHPAHVDEYNRAPRTRQMEAALQLYGLHKDGSEVPVDILLKPVQTAEGLLVLSFIRDVSERRAVEKKLQLANHQLGSLMDNTHVGIYGIDRNWKIVYLNENAKRMLGTGDLSGKSFWDSFPAVSTITRAKLNEAMTTRNASSFESYYEPLDLFSIVSVHPWEDGGLTVFFNNISAHRRLERELEEERAERSQRTETLARLSSSLAHEIKNPLAIIHARASDLAELAAEGDAGPEEVGRACSSIVQTSDRALRILRGVAAMARVGTHDPMQDADVGGMVQQAVELVEGRYKMSGIRLDTVVPTNLPKLECREVQIGQILVNLLNNAFDAIEGDARSERWVKLEVSTQAGAQHENHVERLQIDVIDGGPGVPEEFKRRLMETFFTTKPLGAGIGIGLSVSRTMAEDHGGELRLRECGGHTCFRLTLPMTAAHEEEVLT